MSYDISVFEWPKRLDPPADIEQINRVMEGLSAEPADNGRFKALARALVERFPPSQALDDEDSSGVEATDWSADPVADAETLETAVWRFALPSENRELVLQFLVDQALLLGLTVFDDQIPIALLPSGLILPKEATDAWSELRQILPQLQAEQRRLTKAQVRKMVFPRLKEMLIRHGFEVGKPAPSDTSGEFDARRAGSRGTEEVSCGKIDVYHDSFRLDLGFAAENFGVSRIFSEVLETSARLFFTPGWLFGKSDFLVGDEQEIEAALFHVEMMALPLLDLAATLEGLDEIYNGDLAAVDQRFKGISPQFQPTIRSRGLTALVVAKLAGRDDRYEEVKRYYDGLLKGPGWARTRSDFEKLVSFFESASRSS